MKSSREEIARARQSFIESFELENSKDEGISKEEFLSIAKEYKSISGEHPDIYKFLDRSEHEKIVSLLVGKPDYISLMNDLLGRPELPY